MEITQEMAAKWLAQTRHNRPISKHHVSILASQMEDGLWRSDLAPDILLDEDTGAVIDGQHRLAALSSLPEGSVLKSGVRWVSSDAIAVIDTGRPRNLADTLEILGYEHGKELSALYNTALRWQPVSSNKRTRSAEVKWVTDNPEAQKAAEVAYSTTAGKRGLVYIPTGTVAALWDISQLAGVGGDAVVEFVEEMHMGTHGSETLVRATLMLQEARSKTHSRQMSNTQQSFLVARSFAAWVAQEELSKLYARKSALGYVPGFSEWCEARPIPPAPRDPRSAE